MDGNGNGNLAEGTDRLGENDGSSACEKKVVSTFTPGRDGVLEFHSRRMPGDNSPAAARKGESGAWPACDAVLRCTVP